MKVGSPTFVGCNGRFLAVLIIAGLLSAPAYCQDMSVSLFIQQTPANGGVVSPVAGVYHFVPGSEVTLTAVAEPGYQFVHWLGEVSDPTACSTVVYLDKPKIIVAVFKQAEYGASAAGGGAGGGLVASAADLSQPGALSGAGGGGAEPQARAVADSVEAVDTTPEVPEPATGVLLVLGSLFAFARRGAKRLVR